MLQPKRTKYRRPQRLSYEGLTKGGANVDFGEFGLQALEGAYITNRQIESARIVLAGYTKRAGKIWIRIYPHLAKTKKPAEVRMGSGKGNPEDWVAVVKKNRVLFEIGGVKEEIAREALRLAGFKLPIKTRVVMKGKEE
jgi:large subunit ribosomal protein L16